MASPSLRRRLTGWLLVALLATWAIAGAVLYRDTHREVDAVLDAHLVLTANLLAAQASHELVEVTLEAPDELQAYGQAVAFQAWTPAGALVLRSGNAPRLPFTDAREGFSEVVAEGRHWRVYAGMNRARDLRLLVAEDLAGRDRIERRFIARTFLPMASGLLALGVLVWAIVGRALRPLAGIRAEVGRRNAQDLSPLADHDVPVEVKPLVEQMNALFRRIGRSLDAERRFTAQAAHELRTPVAALRAQAEVAAAATGAAEAREALARVVAGCDRLARLVGQLLVAGRLDERTPLQTETCDLGDIAAQVVAGLAPAAIERRADVELVRDGPVPLQADPHLLQVLLRNLVDNAIRHGGGQVRVTATATGGGVVLVVEDSGPGVDDAELGDLGRPFFRIPGTMAEGTGLGLSIVRRIAEAHGAQLHLCRSAALGGLEVAVRFPANGHGAQGGK